MKIILKDFCYKGKHIDEYACNMPQINNVEDIPEDRIVDYVMENLAILHEEEEA